MLFFFNPPDYSVCCLLFLYSCFSSTSSLFLPTYLLHLFSRPITVFFIPLNYCFSCHAIVFSIVITVIFMYSDLPSFLLVLWPWNTSQNSFSQSQVVEKFNHTLFSYLYNCFLSLIEISDLKKNYPQSTFGVHCLV